MSDDNFLSRWSRRKAGIAEPPVVVELAVAAPAPVAITPAGPAAPAAPEPGPAPLPPTLADVEALDVKATDFKRFVAADVDPSVKNAALKKLFTDPQWNTMDGLDTYIDDYGKPDPLPPGMLRQMAQAHFLKLFDDDSSENPPREHQDTDLRLQPDDAAGPGSDRTSPGEDAGGEP